MIKKHVLIAKACVLFLVPGLIPLYSIAQNTAYTQISLADLSAFKSPPANWGIVGAVKGDFTKEDHIGKQAGQGILLNEPVQKKNEDLFTTFEHGDINLDVDFMMPKGSNSGIYLQGRYEIQLLDSWGKDALTSQDLGSVYERWDETRPNGDFGYNGVAPRVNVSRAPGLWQNIKISFLAPKFDASGKKIANARVVKIVLNDVTILENVELTGPTRGSAFPDEAPMGPIRLQGDHGTVAFRNIKYNTSVITHEFDATKPKGFDYSDRPSFVEVKDEPVVLRSFVNFGDKIITHAVNMGYPHNLNFSYDMENGAIFQVWRGGFVDATPMWWFRGDGTTKALGSVIRLDDAPALAMLANDHITWPDSLSTDQAYRAKGYELDGQGYPTFKYLSFNMTVDDKTAPSEDGKALTRTLTVTGANSNNLYLRAVAVKDISSLGGGMYSINNFEYYIKVDDKFKPVIRNTATGMELMIPVKNTDKGATVSYSMIW